MVEIVSGAVGSLVLVVLAFWIREVVLNIEANAPCKHKVKLRYHSRKEFQCCDCGKRLPMEYDDYPRHQR
jgi:hypothetical protein